MNEQNWQTRIFPDSGASLHEEEKENPEFWGVAGGQQARWGMEENENRKTHREQARSRRALVIQRRQGLFLNTERATSEG